MPPTVQFIGSGISSSSLARIFAASTDRLVVDETHLEGNFDVDLRYADAQFITRIAPNETGPLDQGPSFSTALQEQLGLRLESRKVPQQVFIVEHVERPSAN